MQLLPCFPVEHSTSAGGYYGVFLFCKLFQHLLFKITKGLPSIAGDRLCNGTTQPAGDHLVRIYKSVTKQVCQNPSYCRLAGGTKAGEHHQRKR